MAWQATDADSGVGNFDVRVRRTGPGGTTHPVRTWLDATTAANASFEGVPGSTYCFSARARDREGNESGWSSWRCTALPLDDRALHRHGGWTRAQGDGYYLGTKSTTSDFGARLVRTRLSARRLALVAFRCPRCGVVELRWNGNLLRRVNLSSDQPHAPGVVGRVSFAHARSGRLVIRVVSARKRVIVDGLAASAS